VALALELTNCQPARLDEIPQLGIDEFRDVVLDGVSSGSRLAALFGRPVAPASGTAGTEAGATSTGVRLYAVLANSASGILAVLSADVGDRYQSLTSECPQAHWFEREIAEQWGIKPEGHPWLKPIRFHSSYRAQGVAPASVPAVATDPFGRKPDDPILPGVTNFLQTTSEEMHEVAVGPVHAGIIEPGHFRFLCHGENVLHLEISLGYQHRGVERALVGGPGKRTIHLIETLAGDTTVGHTMAYCHALEALSGTHVPARAQAVRGIALELERLANHTGDLGALAGDVGFLPTMSFCGRIRGDFLNMTAEICGNRFGRGLVRPGGIGQVVDEGVRESLRTRLAAALKDVTGAANLLWETPSVMARFEETGAVSREVCEQLGLVGVAARACGVERDVRFEFPFGIFMVTHIPMSVGSGGDVAARAYVRWFEIQRSAAFIQEQLNSLPENGAHVELGKLANDSIVVSLTEGWRGEICHVAMTSGEGRLAHYKVVDPSFHNWMGLAMSLRGQQISDFPLCNKSFNLSYCGHDL
jgi:Ni,Fe-hydrogenase III large subunit